MHLLLFGAAMTVLPLALSAMGFACRGRPKLLHDMLTDASANVQQELLMAPILILQPVDAMPAMEAFKAASPVVSGGHPTHHLTHTLSSLLWLWPSPYLQPKDLYGCSFKCEGQAFDVDVEPIFWQVVLFDLAQFHCPLLLAQFLLDRWDV